MNTAQMVVRRSLERGHVDHGWLTTYHTFSFADYHDPNHMGFRSLRVINDDTIAGGGGFGMHPHRDMEIITYVLSGALEHRDSMGNSAVIRAGDVQQMSAGTGVRHSEFNHSPVEPVHLLQIWILPDERGVAPKYAERSFANAAEDSWHLVASRTGRNGSISIHQDASLSLAKLTEGSRLKFEIPQQRYGWVQIAEGALKLNGEILYAGDGASVQGGSELEFVALDKSQVLLFDLG